MLRLPEPLPLMMSPILGSKIIWTSASGVTWRSKSSFSAEEEISGFLWSFVLSISYWFKGILACFLFTNLINFDSANSFLVPIGIEMDVFGSVVASISIFIFLGVPLISTLPVAKACPKNMVLSFSVVFKHSNFWASIVILSISNSFKFLYSISPFTIALLPLLSKTSISFSKNVFLLISTFWVKL